MRHILLSTLCASALFCAVFSTAHAQQTRIAIGAGGGMSVPIGPSERFIPRWENPEYNGLQAPTQLVHYRPKLGMAFHLETSIRELTIRYTFQRHLWKRDRVACVPAEDNVYDAVLLPNGEFDDRNVLYHCDAGGARIPADPSRRAHLVHQLDVSYAFVAVRPRIIIPYAKVGGGVLLTMFHPSEQNNSIRLGLSVLAGGGLRIPLDRNISFYVETHYALNLMSRGGDYSLRAGRAVASDKTVLSALFSPMHTIQATVGIRVRVR